MKISILPKNPVTVEGTAMTTAVTSGQLVHQTHLYPIKTI